MQWSPTKPAITSSHRFNREDLGSKAGQTRQPGPSVFPKNFLELGYGENVLGIHTVRPLSPTRLLPVLVCACFSACSLIAHYDQTAYEHATDAKVDTLALMNKATDDYQAHEKEVETLINQLDKAYEYDRGRQLNQITVAQWDILRDPNR